MGIFNSPENFQHKMNDLVHEFEFIRSYIGHILVSTKGVWTDHEQKLELTLNKPIKKGLKCNIEKSFFRKTKM